jgi:pilus assembly protein Flp/PilA
MALKFPTREEGQGLVEYALILVLVAIVVIAILLILGPVVGNVFSNIVVNLTRGGGGGGQTVEITSFNISSSGTLTCVVNLTNLQVLVTENGAPVSNANVSASVTLRGGAAINLSGTTSGSGIAGWPAQAIGSDGSGCGSGGTATASAGGDSEVRSY